MPLYFNRQWNQFANQHHFNPTTGYIVPRDFYPVNFDYQTIEKVINISVQSITSNQFLQLIQTIPLINIYIIDKYQELIILKDSFAFILNKFLWINKKQNKVQNNVRVPYKIAKPLYEVALKLQTKFGLSANISFNRKQINKQQTSQQKLQNYNDFDLRWYFTENKEKEKIFFGTYIISSLQMTKIVRSSYLINQTIQNNGDLIFIRLQLKSIVESFSRIIIYLKRMINELDWDYFNKNLRFFFAGFNNLYFQGVDKNLSSSGSSTAEDPTYIMFQRAFSISFNNNLAKIQQHLRQGMFGKHKQIQDYFQFNSKIKGFCIQDEQLIQYYNQVISVYSHLNKMQSCLISKLILGNVSKQQEQKKKEPSNNTISHLMNRWKKVEQFKITQKNIEQLRKAKRQNANKILDIINQIKN